MVIGVPSGIRRASLRMSAFRTRMHRARCGRGSSGFGALLLLSQATAVTLARRSGARGARLRCRSRLRPPTARPDTRARRQGDVGRRGVDLRWSQHDQGGHSTNQRARPLRDSTGGDQDVPGRPRAGAQPPVRTRRRDDWTASRSGPADSRSGRNHAGPRPRSCPRPHAQRSRGVGDNRARRLLPRALPCKWGGGRNPRPDPREGFPGRRARPRRYVVGGGCGNRRLQSAHPGGTCGGGSPDRNDAHAVSRGAEPTAHRAGRGAIGSRRTRTSGSD